MKFFLLLTATLVFTSFQTTHADQYVHGYTRQNGTYVEPYHRSSPDASTSNNYSTRGNSNPYTGQGGTRPETNNGFAVNSNPYAVHNSNSGSAYQLGE